MRDFFISVNFADPITGTIHRLEIAFALSAGVGCKFRSADGFAVGALIYVGYGHAVVEKIPYLRIAAEFAFQLKEIGMVSTNASLSTSEPVKFSSV